jgi:hypothetical protein
MGESGGIAPPILTSALDGGELSVSCPSHFTPQGKSAQYPLDGTQGGSQRQSGCYGEKSCPCQESNPRPSSLWPVAILTELSRGRDCGKGWKHMGVN